MPIGLFGRAALVGLTVLPPIYAVIVLLDGRYLFGVVALLLWFVWPKKAFPNRWVQAILTLSIKQEARDSEFVRSVVQQTWEIARKGVFFALLCIGGLCQYTLQGSALPSSRLVNPSAERAPESSENGCDQVARGASKYTPS